ncbi:SP17 protein, partial [Polypterus senegalus]
MAVPLSNTNLRVPQGFGNVLEGLTREILREQPADIPTFAALYFKMLVKKRQETGFDSAEWGAKIEDRYYNNRAFQGRHTFTIEEHKAAVKIQATYRGFITRKKLKSAKGHRFGEDKDHLHSDFFASGQFDDSHDIQRHHGLVAASSEDLEGFAAGHHLMEGRGLVAASSEDLEGFAAGHRLSEGRGLVAASSEDLEGFAAGHHLTEGEDTTFGDDISFERRWHGDDDLAELLEKSVLGQRDGADHDFSGSELEDDKDALHDSQAGLDQQAHHLERASLRHRGSQRASFEDGGDGRISWGTQTTFDKGDDATQLHGISLDELERLRRALEEQSRAGRSGGEGIEGIDQTQGDQAGAGEGQEGGDQSAQDGAAAGTGAEDGAGDDQHEIAGVRHVEDDYYDDEAPEEDQDEPPGLGAGDADSTDLQELEPVPVASDAKEELELETMPVQHWAMLKRHRLEFIQATDILNPLYNLQGLEELELTLAASDTKEEPALDGTATENGASIEQSIIPTA